MFSASRRESRRGETKVLNVLSAACAKKTNMLRTRAALTPAHNARESREEETQPERPWSMVFV